MAIDVSMNAQLLGRGMRKGRVRTKTSEAAIDTMGMSDMPMMSGGRMKLNKALMLKMGMTVRKMKERMARRGVGRGMPMGEE